MFAGVHRPSSCTVLISCYLAPPVVVRKIVPKCPTAGPVMASVKETP